MKTYQTIENHDGQTVRLAELTRGGIVESSHRGALAVVDSDGNLLAAAGDPDFVTYMRSSAKPFQAIPTVESGALDYFGLDEENLALMCASHHGTEEHVAVVQRTLERLGLDHTALHCGIHWPISPEATRALAAAGLEPDARHNNCSGKHSGMLTLARFWNAPLESYTELAHPVQQAIIRRLAGLAGLPVEAIHTGSDGCTVPVFALPLRNAALAYARLLAADAPPAFRRIVAAMQAHPHLVSGRGALTDLLMRAGQGNIVCKGGAEGYFGLAVRTPAGRSVGVALKIADGNARAQRVVLVAVLERLGLVDAATLERLEPLRRPRITNRRQQVVGEMRAAFELKSR